MSTGEKRKAPPSSESTVEKKLKTKRKWQVPKRGAREEAKIETGDAGIWATCDKGREGRCVNELKDLFQDYAEKLYGEQSDADDAADDEEEIDIEAEIKDEIDEMKKPAKEPLVSNVKIDVQCVIFLKTREPISPANFVHSICKDAMKSGKKRTRFVKRLTPMTCMGKATEAGLEEVARKVLEPHFHNSTSEDTPRKFAIRTSIRNHAKILTRDSIIKQVASLVGVPHKVDLTNPELIILVEVYKNHCGMSVVDGDFEALKRFNLSEIYEPSALSNPQKDASEA